MFVTGQLHLREPSPRRHIPDANTIPVASTRQIPWTHDVQTHDLSVHSIDYSSYKLVVLLGIVDVDHMIISRTYQEVLQIQQLIQFSFVVTQEQLLCPCSRVENANAKVSLTSAESYIPISEFSNSNDSVKMVRPDQSNLILGVEQLIFIDHCGHANLSMAPH